MKLRLPTVLRECDKVTQGMPSTATASPSIRPKAIRKEKRRLRIELSFVCGSRLTVKRLRAVISLCVFIHFSKFVDIEANTENVQIRK
jgi:hypothetical protein